MWLAVIATVLVLDSVLIITVTIIWVRLCERAVTAMVTYERERLVPAIRRASVLADEVLERDRHRWELDPASSDDWPHKKQ